MIVAAMGAYREQARRRREPAAGFLVADVPERTAIGESGV